MNKYLDKTGREIKAGMTIQHDDGTREKVIAVKDDYGQEELGIPCGKYEAYYLFQFATDTEWIIVEQ